MTGSLTRTLLCAAGLAAACADPQPEPVTVTDSAGMEIVVSREPSWNQGQGWTVSAEPATEISGDDRNAVEMFHSIRGVVVLTDGRIVVADGATSELRVFSNSGKHVTTWSRRGGGPGEFEEIDWIYPFRGDSVLAVDGQNRRISIFGDQGFVRMFTPRPSDGGHYWFRGSLRDGSIVIATVAERIRTGEPGISRISEQLMHLSDTGAYIDSLQVVPGQERFIREDASGNLSILRPFGRRTIVLATGSSVFIGSTDSYEISVQLPDGTPVRSVRRLLPVEALTKRDIAEFKTAEAARELNLGVDPGFRATLERVREESIYPRTKPAFQGFLVDAQGNLWVRENGHPGDPVGTWSVYDSTGKWLGLVQTPSGLQVTYIGDDLVAGIWRDESDVEHARVYSIVGN